MKLLRLLLLACALGCAPKYDDSPGRSYTLQVENNRWNRATIYQGCSRSFMRVDAVEAMSTLNHSVRLCDENSVAVRMLAGGTFEYTENILVAPGCTLKLTLENGMPANAVITVRCP